MFKPFNKTDREKRRAKKDALKKKKVFRKKPCRFCADKVEKLDYLDYMRFQKLLTERGKIMPSRISGNCAVHQRQMARAIKRARVMGLLPFVAE
jgi:small subunit ribosomal protein S18